MLFSMPFIIQHSYNFFSSCTPKPKLWILLPLTPNPKLLTAKLEGLVTNLCLRMRPLFSLDKKGTAILYLYTWLYVIKKKSPNAARFHPANFRYTHMGHVICTYHSEIFFLAQEKLYWRKKVLPAYCHFKLKE